MAIFFRLVRTDPPTLDDFRSHAALGDVPPHVKTGPQREPYRRLSLWATLPKARACARRTRHRYAYVAVLDVPSTAPVAQRGRDPDHYEIHEHDAPPEVMRTWMVRVLPARVK